MPCLWACHVEEGQWALLNVRSPAAAAAAAVAAPAAEFLCRAGVGSMTLVDGDTVDTTNRNRQLPALASTVGKLKTKVRQEKGGFATRVGCQRPPNASCVIDLP
jgi:molybdopterin/thiamine biosynthesis adenylyltransferase